MFDRNPTQKLSQKISALLAAATLIGLVGCQALTIEQKQVSSASPPDMITVQIRRPNRTPKTKQIPLKPDMRLQEVVEACKAPFRNKVAYIVRTSPKTGDQHKLEASFSSSRRISLETDYAIQPGDRVVIAEDTTSSIERVMKSMLGRD